MSQNAKADARKPKLTLVPTQFIRDVALVREYGVKKYKDPENWRNVEVGRYDDALFRHLLAYLDNPDGVDEESGLKHYQHMACNLAFICEIRGGVRKCLNCKDYRETYFENMRLREIEKDYIRLTDRNERGRFVRREDEPSSRKYK